MLFAITGEREPLRPRRNELLAARQTAPRRWEASIGSVPMTFLPYLAIEEEQYSTFLPLVPAALHV